jgi:signal transduction histidine kinase
LHSVTLNLQELIEECVATVEPRARARQLRLLRNVEADLPRVNGDRRALKQILLNLLTNSIKFSVVNGSIEAFARLVPSGELSFGVKDNGIGIAEEDRARVFERFGQGRHDITDSETGAGLGLPIVKGLVEAHGGRIQMDSRLAHGTCVTIWWPCERLETPARIAIAS